MKRLFFVLLVLLFPAEIFAAPFLGCDCTPATDLVTSFQLQFDTAAWIDSPAVLTCGAGDDKITCTGNSKTVCYDLAAISVGPHTVKAKALNAWGSSVDSTPFLFTKGTVPSSPSLLKIVK
jgi:hypothetical protein